jgi:hypothetical protein
VTDARPPWTDWRDTPGVMRLLGNAPVLSMLYFGAPVYLVGGALTDPDPRDLDVVIVLPDDLFVAAYGDREGWTPAGVDLAVSQWSGDLASATPGPLWRRWARDCAKWNTQLTRRCHRRVDFKTQPAVIAAGYEGRPRARLDVLDPRE